MILSKLQLTIHKRHYVVKVKIQKKICPVHSLTSSSHIIFLIRDVPSQFFSFHLLRLDITEHFTYLHYPHFHFAGRFRADTATLNNFPNLFNPEEFVQSQTQPNADNWNPMGSGEWTVEAEVTHVCYSDYQCVGNLPGEPLCGAGITGN